MESEDDALLSVAEAATLLGMHPSSVRRLIGRGELPAARKEWAFAIRRSDVLALKAKPRPKPGPKPGVPHPGRTPRRWRKRPTAPPGA